MPVLYDPTGAIMSALDVPSMGGDVVMDRGMRVTYKQVHAAEPAVESAINSALGL